MFECQISVNLVCQNVCHAMKPSPSYEPYHEKKTYSGSDSYQSVHQIHLRNEFDFWNVHGIMNTSGLLQSN